MLGFIAEYTGKTMGYIAELADDAWEDTKSISERFTQGYDSVIPPTPQNNDIPETEEKLTDTQDIQTETPTNETKQGEDNVVS